MAVLLSTAGWAAEQPALSDRAYRAVNKAQALITEKKYGEANAKLQEALSGAGERVYDKGSFCRPWASWRRNKRSTVRRPSTSPMPSPLAGCPSRWPSRCATTWPSSTWRRELQGLHQHHEPVVREPRQGRETDPARLHHAGQRPCAAQAVSRSHSGGGQRDQALRGQGAGVLVPAEDGSSLRAEAVRRPPRC